MQSFNSFADLSQYLDESQEYVKTMRMEELRNLHGKGRNGKIVQKSIEDKLQECGLDFYPKSTPGKNTVYGKTQVRVFKCGMHIEELIKAFTKPSANNDQLMTIVIQQLLIYKEYEEKTAELIKKAEALAQTHTRALPAVTEILHKQHKPSFLDVASRW